MKKKSKFLTEFRNFIMRGNVIDMAVGVVVGGAFSKIVSSLVANIITPLISLVTNTSGLANLKYVVKAEHTKIVDGAETTVPEVAVEYGLFFQYIIDFLIISFCIFVVIKILAKLREKGEKIKETPEKIAAKKAEEEKAAAEKTAAEEKAAKEAEEIVAARRAQAETAELLRDIKELLQNK